MPIWEASIAKTYLQVRKQLQAWLLLSLLILVSGLLELNKDWANREQRHPPARKGPRNKLQAWLQVFGSLLHRKPWAVLIPFPNSILLTNPYCCSWNTGFEISSLEDMFVDKILLHRLLTGAYITFNFFLLSCWEMVCMSTITRVVLSPWVPHLILNFLQRFSKVIEI